MGKQWKQWADFIFLGPRITVDGDFCHEIRRHLLLGSKAMTSLDRILKIRDITLPTKVCLVKSMVFSVVMYGCECWTIKRLSAEELILLNCGVGEDSWESLDCKEINPINSKGNESWIHIGRTDAKAEAPILWPLDAKSWLLGKKPWCWEGLKAGGEGDDRGWGGWKGSLTQWTRVWARCGWSHY